MRYPRKDGPDTLAIKLPIPCKKLRGGGEETFYCSIYDRRPKVCKNYFCKTAKEEEIVQLGLAILKENNGT